MVHTDYLTDNILYAVRLIHVDTLREQLRITAEEANTINHMIRVTE